MKDGHIILAVGNDSQFRKFCAVVGLDALATQAEFATNPARVTNRAALRAAVIAALADIMRDDLLRKLEAQGVPASSNPARDHRPWVDYSDSRGTRQLARRECGN